MYLENVCLDNTVVLNVGSRAFVSFRSANKN